MPYNNYREKTLNSSEFPFFNSYAGVPTDVDYIAGTAAGGWNNVRYIDGYARTNPMEDRAGTLEYTSYDSYAAYYEHPAILRKAQFLCGLIREAFPSAAACDTELFGEHRTGIIELRQAFPYFFAAG